LDRNQKIGKGIYYELVYSPKAAVYLTTELNNFAKNKLILYDTIEE